MKWIKTGVTREVFLVGRWAIKTPKLTGGWKMFLQGLLCNMMEREFSAMGWPELCPVVSSLPGGWLVIMRRAEPLADEELSDLDVFAFFSPEDGRVIPGEAKGSSLGRLDGRIVIIDYGEA